MRFPLSDNRTSTNSLNERYIVRRLETLIIDYLSIEIAFVGIIVAFFLMYRLKKIDPVAIINNSLKKCQPGKLRVGYC